MHVTVCEYLVFHEFRRSFYITLAKYLEQQSIADLLLLFLSSLILCIIILDCICSLRPTSQCCLPLVQESREIQPQKNHMRMFPFILLLLLFFLFVLFLFVCCFVFAVSKQLCYHKWSVRSKQLPIRVGIPQPNTNYSILLLFLAVIECCSLFSRGLTAHISLVILNE